MVLYDTRYNETIRADDGHRLRAAWFRPTDARGAVLLAPAMATPSTFYRPLARWLADAGFLTLTFDYRGTGSRDELRAERGDLVRWGGDAASALEALVEQADGLPVTWVGHSLGGQVLPFAHHGLVDRAVNLASGSGYWRYNAPAVRRRAPLLWHTVGPAAIAATGYFPGRRLGIIGDVPPNVMRQWRRWCLSPGYFEPDVPRVAERFARVTTPVTSLWFTDDELLTATAIDRLDDLFTGTMIERLRIDPADHGLSRVGHHGFYRESGRPLWEPLLLPRLAAVPGPEPLSEPEPAPEHVRVPEAERVPEPEPVLQNSVSGPAVAGRSRSSR